MKTIRQTLEAFLTEFGLWPKEATEVVNEFAARPESQSIRFDDPAENSGYPPQVFAVMKVAVKSGAIAYLEKNKPQHFALAMLKGEIG